jgi:hypothetical protein
MGQPDDRVGNRAARWSREGDDLVVREVDGTAAWRIVEHSRDRLLVRMD